MLTIDFGQGKYSGYSQTHKQYLLGYSDTVDSFSKVSVNDFSAKHQLFNFSCKPISEMFHCWNLRLLAGKSCMVGVLHLTLPFSKTSKKN